MWFPADALNKGSTISVEGKGTRYMKWLARGNVSINLCGAHRRKVYGSAAYLLNGGKLFIFGLTDPIP